MHVQLPGRVWAVLLAIDVGAFALIGVGLATGVALLAGAGIAGIVATSVAGVLLQTQGRRRG